MKKTLFAIVLSATVSQLLFSEGRRSAYSIKSDSLKKPAVLDTIEYLKSHLKESATRSDERSLLYFTGTIQEQLGLFTDASQSYHEASLIDAPDAEKMAKATKDDLILASIRTLLSAGDHEDAEKLIERGLKETSETKSRAFLNLYSVWCVLCKAETMEGTRDSVSLLKTYSTMQSMSCVKPQILFTLWYLTNDCAYADLLKKEFPSSPESAIINGKSQIASVPFWYFVPRGNLEVRNEKKEDSNVSVKEKQAPKQDVAVKKQENQKKESEVKFSQYERAKPSCRRQQIGLFKEEKNAEILVKNVRKKGFDAYYYKEKRASGVTYFIAVVEENSASTIGKELRSQGFDCYSVK